MIISDFTFIHKIISSGLEQILEMYMQSAVFNNIDWFHFLVLGFFLFPK